MTVVNRVVILPATDDLSKQAGAVAAVPEDPFRRAQQFAEHAIAWPSDRRRSVLPPTAGSGAEQFVSRTIPPADRASEAPAAAPAERQGSAPLLDAPSGPSVASQFAARRVADPATVVPVGGNLPPGERPRMTRFHHFQLDYAVESVGSSGILKVELWGTSDLGRTWSVRKHDEDLESPVDVQVDKEGVHGFRVVVVAKNGLAG
jgi:hypothetical protein